MIALVVLQAVTAFSARCAELQHDQPSLRCEPVARTRAGGHAVELWQTVVALDEEGGRETDVYVAIEAPVGWFVSEPVAMVVHREPAPFETSTVEIDRIDADAIRVGGEPAVRVRVREHWRDTCVECDPRPRIETGRQVDEMVCIVSTLVPLCVLAPPSEAS